MLFNEFIKTFLIMNQLNPVHTLFSKIYLNITQVLSSLQLIQAQLGRRKCFSSSDTEMLRAHPVSSVTSTWSKATGCYSYSLTRQLLCVKTPAWYPLADPPHTCVGEVVYLTNNTLEICDLFPRLYIFIMILCVMTTCGLVADYRRFGGRYRMYLVLQVCMTS